MKYLNHVHTLDELKKEYRNLAIKLHPDHGGSTAEMQILNAEYEAVFAKVKNIRTAANGGTYTEKTTETPDMFKGVIEKIITLDVIIEIVGSWIWITGNTYPVKDRLKAAGMRWSKKHQAWYWHSPEEHTKGKGKDNLDKIKDKYGCTTIKKVAMMAAAI